MKVNVEFNTKDFFKDIMHTYGLGIKKAFYFIFKHWLKSLIVIIVFIAVAFFVSWTAAFFLSFFLAFLIMHLDSRVPIAFALIFLVACPFLLLFQYQKWAETTAIYAYYFLVIGVILQIIEFIREPKQAEDSKEAVVPAKKEAKSVSEGVFLTEVDTKQSKMPVEHKAWKIVLMIILILLAIGALTIGGIFLVNSYILAPAKSVVSEIPSQVKENNQNVPSLPSDQQTEKSAVSITVLNGNGTPGSANNLKASLENQGFKVSAVGDADTADYPETIIRYQPGSQKNAQLIADALKNNYQTKLEETNVSQETEIVVIVGIK
jgi:ABC-type multidrug transport system fused ATPase/permease subunit